MKVSPLRKILFYIAGSLLILFMVLYLVMTHLSQSTKIREINEIYGFKPEEKSKPDYRIFSDSSYISINREKAFYQARLIMAESDSVSLALNLKDSTAILEINGVRVHEANLSEIKISRVLNRSDEYSVTAMLSAPLKIKYDIATIKKEPLMIKMAPKDTSEYKPDILPDTTRFESVNYIFEMEKGMRLYVYQTIDEDQKDGLKVFTFDLNNRLKDLGENLKSILRLKIPEYHPSITVRMTRTDARIIYRALPRQGLVAVSR
jgi:hypothetical protein